MKNDLTANLNKLIEKWEQRADLAKKSRNDAAGAGEWNRATNNSMKEATLNTVIKELKAELK